MSLAPNLLNKPVQVVLANSTGDSADPIVVTPTLGAVATQRIAYTLTVAQGEQTSSAIDLGVDTACALKFPAALTSTAATIQVSNSGATWVTVKNTDGTAYSLTVAANFGVPLKLEVMFAWRYARVVMGTAEAAVRSIILIARPI